MAVDVEAFCRWAQAQGATAEALSHFRSGAQRLLARAGGGPVDESHIEALIAADAASGAAPADLRNLRRIGAALIRFQQEAPAAPPATARPAPRAVPLKVVDPRQTSAAESWDRRHAVFRPTSLALVALAAVALVWGSFRAYRRVALGRQDALIERMSAYHHSQPVGRVVQGLQIRPAADVTLVFRKAPPGADPRDVQLRFTSAALERDHVVDWAFIARQARDERTERRLEAARPEGPPPLGVPMLVTVFLPMKKELQALRTDLVLTATLTWGGVRQDTHKLSLGPFFEKKR